jgi:microcystin-dependent protein
MTPKENEAMTTYNLSEWSQEASNNNAASPAGAPEGWTGKEVNNTIRENMAVIREWYDDPEWLSLLPDMNPRSAKTVTKVSDSVFRINTIDQDQVEYFNEGRRVVMLGGEGAEQSFIVGATAGGGNIDVTILGTNVPTSISENGILLYFARSLDPSAFSAAIGVGDLRMTSGPVRQAAIDGWVACDGAEHLVTTYPVLADLYGSTGFGNGAYDTHPTMGVPADTYFRVPDMRGRVPIGYWDALDSDAEPDGDYDNYPDAGGSDPDSTFYGEKSHELTEDEGPAHEHGTDTSTDGDHIHATDSDGAGGTITASAVAGSGVPRDPGIEDLVQSGGDHSHTITSSGLGDAHENRQLSTVMGYLVYTGVF